MLEYPGTPPMGENGVRESVSKHVWIKLTGPAAGSLTEAFFGPSVTVLQENMGAQIGAKGVTTQAEDTAQKEEECTTNEAGRGKVTPNDIPRTTERIEPETVPPTMIAMARTTAGAQKYIKVQKMYRIVLLGDTRAGKSSLANTVFGEDVFKTDNSECQAESKSVHGRRITLINTPDFFGPGRSEEELKPEILRCITECTPGPHAFLIVLKVEKSTEQQQVVIDKICQYFSEEVFKYATVVFTQDDQVSEGLKIKEFVDQNTCLSDLVKKCKSQYHIINKYNQQGDNISNQSQVAELLNAIDQIVKENKGKCYTSKMLPHKDTSNKSDNSVSKNGLIKLTGPAADSVAKAFFGPAVVVLTQGTANGAETKEADEGDPPKKEERPNRGDAPEEKKEMQKETEKAQDRVATISKQGGKSSEGGGLGSFVSSSFSFFLGLGVALLGGGAVYIVAAMAGVTVLTAAAAAVAALAIATFIAGFFVGGGITAAAVVGLLIYIKNKVIEWIEQHLGVVLLVVVFFVLLLLWFFLKVPFTGTFLLLLLFLLLVIIVVII